MKTISAPFDKFAITKFQQHNFIAGWLTLIWQKIQSGEVPEHLSNLLEAEFLLDMAQVGEVVMLRFSADVEQDPHCMVGLIDVQFGHHALTNPLHLDEQLRQNLLENLERHRAAGGLGTAVLDARIRKDTEAGNVLHCRVSTRVSGAEFLQDYKKYWAHLAHPFSSNWADRLSRGYYGARPLQSPIYAHNAFHSPGEIPPEYRAADVQYPAADAQPIAPSKKREEAVDEAGSDVSYRQEFDKYDFEALNQKFLELVVEKAPDYLKADWSLKAYEFEVILIGSEVVLCWKAWHEGFWRVILSGQKSMSEMSDNTEVGRTLVLQELGTWMPMGEWPMADRVKDIEAQTTCVSAKKTIRRTGVFNSDAAG